MIRTFQPIDVLRYAIFKHPNEQNRVQLLEDLVKGKTPRLTFAGMCQEALPNPQKIYPLVWSSHQNILGLGAIRERAGNRAWEVSRLFLDSSDEAQDCLPLLEKLSQLAIKRGAQKIFLRLPANDSLEEVCRRAGFFPYYQELAFSGNPSLGQTNTNPTGWRPRASSDNQPLFRLYNAAVPHKVRTAVGLTMEEWQDSQERCSQKCQEFVYERNGEVLAWLRIMSDYNRYFMDAVAHPQEESSLLENAFKELSAKNNAKTLMCALVPEHQAHFQEILSRNGFQKMAQYVITVKFTAKRVEKETVASTKTAPIGG